jgi:hypothetical protein
MEFSAGFRCEIDEELVRVAGKEEGEGRLLKDN